MEKLNRERSSKVIRGSIPLVTLLEECIAIIVLNDLMDDVILGLDNSLVYNFLTFRINGNQVRKWAN